MFDLSEYQFVDMSHVLEYTCSILYIYSANTSIFSDVEIIYDTLTIKKSSRNRKKEMRIGWKMDCYIIVDHCVVQTHKYWSQN